MCSGFILKSEIWIFQSVSFLIWLHCCCVAENTAFVCYTIARIDEKNNSNHSERMNLKTRSVFISSLSKYKFPDRTFLRILQCDILHITTRLILV